MTITIKNYGFVSSKLHFFIDLIHSLVTLIRHPSEAMGVPLHQQQNKCTALVKNRTAATATAALQFTCPVFTANTASPAAGNTNATQAQVCVFPLFLH